jgi:bis(5'-nucleosyl)-tetraphosphatase (symmetrical)
MAHKSNEPCTAASWRPYVSAPDIWMIGDIQGCLTPLDALLSQPLIAQNPSAQFWFAGDLVNRGPSSLQTLRRLMSLEDRSVFLLGNHDLHLLAVAAGIRAPGKNDTFQEVLTAPDAGDIIHWLRHRKLAHFDLDHLMIHAGVLPKWSVKKTLSLAAEVEQALRSDGWAKLLQKMYGNEPAHWKDGHTGTKRLRVIMNALTRLRMCNPKGHMMLTVKSSPKDRSDGLIPWFDLPDRATHNVTVVFGHWSTLGLLNRPNVICLDTGCVWGGHLTAMRLQDRQLVQVACHQEMDPLAVS